MNAPIAFGELVERIYSAAVEPTSWASVLGDICQHVDPTMSVAILSQDLATKTGTINAAWEYDPEFLRLYVDEYIKINPTLDYLAYLPEGQTMMFSRQDSFESVTASRFYHEWAEPQGIADALMTTLSRDGSQCTALSFSMRTKRRGFNPRTLQRLAAFSPHIQRSLRLGDLASGNASEHRAMSSLIEELAAAVFVIDVDRRLLYANRSGDAMREEGLVFSPYLGRLTCSDPVAQQSLEALIALGAGSLNANLPALPLKAVNGRPYILHALPLAAAPTQWRLNGNEAGAMILFIQDAPIDLSAPARTIGRLYRLTPMETAVLVAIVCEGGVPAVSQRLGIAESTVKSHLKQIFEKTGTHRQIDLVKLVSAASGPFRKS